MRPYSPHSDAPGKTPVPRHKTSNAHHTSPHPRLTHNKTNHHSTPRQHRPSRNHVNPRHRTHMRHRPTTRSSNVIRPKPQRSQSHAQRTAQLQNPINRNPSRRNPRRRRLNNMRHNRRVHYNPRSHHRRRQIPYHPQGPSKRMNNRR